MAAFFAGASPVEDVVEFFADLFPGVTVLESAWGVELRPLRPAPRRELIIIVNGAREAMPELLRRGTHWLKLPLDSPHGLSEEVAFVAAAHRGDSRA